MYRLWPVLLGIGVCLVFVSVLGLFVISAFPPDKRDTYDDLLLKRRITWGSVTSGGVGAFCLIVAFGCWDSIQVRRRRFTFLTTCRHCRYDLRTSIATGRPHCPECGAKIHPKAMELDIDLNTQT